ncbi:unnamed protein product [Parajaminaea phylloscopi]
MADERQTGLEGPPPTAQELPFWSSPDRPQPRHGLKAWLARILRKVRGTGNHKFLDALHVHGQAIRDLSDVAVHPELQRDASLRRDNCLSEQESAFLEKRKASIAASAAFRDVVGARPDEVVDPRDVPVVSIGGSGGGYRALLGYLGLIETLQRERLWDLVAYASGVSGSCWTLAALYAVAGVDAAALFDGLRCDSRHHPLSLSAIDAVARSVGGVYHQLAPILQKLHLGHLHPGPLDLYGTLITSHLFLSASGPRKGTERRDEDGKQTSPSIRREWYQWSRCLVSAGIGQGHQPLPILTAVRHERSWKDWQPDADDSRDPSHRGQEGRHPAAGTPGPDESWWQWFEVSPIEIGSDELEGWVPTWAFGRRFQGGQSQERLPERSLSLLLGMCTSAPAGPLAAWLQTLYRNLPTGRLGSKVRRGCDEWVDAHPQEAQRLQSHHPVHAINEANPFFGAEQAPGRGHGFENSPRVHLVDSGVSNNLPLGVLFRPGREVDVVVCGDYSSDVQGGAAVSRIADFGKERGYRIEGRSPVPTSEQMSPEGKQSAPHTASDVERKFAGQYAQVYDLVPLDCSGQGADAGVTRYNARHQPQCTRKSRLLYMPLLPHRCQPEYDPSTAPFSSSYNLAWTQEQVDTIRKTANADALEGCDTLRGLIRGAYEAKRAARLGAAVVTGS